MPSPSQLIESLPTQWQQVTVGQMYLLQTPLPQSHPLQRLQWQAVCLSKYSRRQWDTLPEAYWQKEVLQRLSFLQMPVAEVLRDVPNHKGVHWQNWHWPPDLGNRPLGVWLWLEREWLQVPQRWQQLCAGNIGQLPRLLALLGTPQPNPLHFDERQWAAHTHQLHQLPMPVALAAWQQVQHSLLSLMAQYPELFPEPDPNPEDSTVPPHVADPLAQPETLSETPLQNYYRRWGWNALLANLYGGQLTPGQRTEAMAAPIHGVFQELARQLHLTQVQAAAHPTAHARRTVSD